MQPLTQVTLTLELTHSNFGDPDVDEADIIRNERFGIPLRFETKYNESDIDKVLPVGQTKTIVLDMADFDLRDLFTGEPLDLDVFRVDLVSENFAHGNEFDPLLTQLIPESAFGQIAFAYADDAITTYAKLELTGQRVPEPSALALVRSGTPPAQTTAF